VSTIITAIRGTEEKKEKSYGTWIKSQKSFQAVKKIRIHKILTERERQLHSSCTRENKPLSDLHETFSLFA